MLQNRWKSPFGLTAIVVFAGGVNLSLLGCNRSTSTRGQQASESQMSPALTTPSEENSPRKTAENSAIAPPVQNTLVSAAALHHVTATAGNFSPGEYLVRRWWTEKQTDAANQSTPANPIAEGRYWIGSTDQVLIVQGEQYRYEDAEEVQPWNPLSDLKAIKKGIIFDGSNYWCLSTLAPKNEGAIACAAEGWVTGTN
jgi:hypothetical protein